MKLDQQFDNQFQIFGDRLQFIIGFQVVQTVEEERSFKFFFQKCQVKNKKLSFLTFIQKYILALDKICSVR